MDKNTQLLFGLVTSLSSQAWIQLGKIKNPINDKIVRDIEAASMTIDMLAMLKEKTSGNIGESEEKYLEQIIHDLQMNFVFEKEKGDEPVVEPETKKEPESPEPDKDKKDKKNSPKKRKKKSESKSK